MAYAMIKNRTPISQRVIVSVFVGAIVNHLHHSNPVTISLYYNLSLISTMATTIAEDKWKVNDIVFYVKSTLPPAGIPTVAKLLFLHGFAGHVNRYNQLFNVLSSKGIEVFAFDQRGAGQTSPEKKDWGLTDEKMVFLDLEEIIKRRIEPEVVDDKTLIPWFMIGFSMGGGICFNYAIKGQHRKWFAGYIGISPWVLLHPRARPNPIVYQILLGISKVYPRFQYFTGMDFNFLCRDPAEVQDVKDDPMCNPVCTLKQMADTIERGRRLLDKNYCSNFVSRSVLIIHGDADKIVSYDASKEFIHTLPVKDKQLVTIEGGYHELPIELDRDRKKLHDELTGWILDKSRGKMPN
ncbi:Alpha/Beta hydrolase protein [Lipomyces orientalis]|uniref:Alpha/Beta hydrolase protein n=1 Tax=Lipomyces orientalis TaxID=1233043 RepID=A0ACC3TEV0_9ASCO